MIRSPRTCGLGGRITVIEIDASAYPDKFLNSLGDHRNSTESRPDGDGRIDPGNGNTAPCQRIIHSGQRPGSGRGRPSPSRTKEHHNQHPQGNSGDQGEQDQAGQAARFLDQHLHGHQGPRAEGRDEAEIHHPDVQGAGGHLRPGGGLLEKRNA